MATVLREKIVHLGYGEPGLEQWVEQDIEGGWVAAFKLDWTGSRHVVAELRIVRGSTTDEQRAPGEGLTFAADAERVVLRLKAGALNPHAPDASEGLTARIARGARFHETLAVARVALEREIAAAKDPEATRRYLQTARLAETRQQPGERGRFWSDVRYVELASAYVDAVRGGSRRPIADLATSPAYRSYSEARIRQALAHARAEGWLSETTRRRAGGEITAKGFEVLDRAKEEQGQ